MLLLSPLGVRAEDFAAKQSPTTSKFTYLTFKQTPEQIGELIENLMMH